MGAAGPAGFAGLSLRERLAGLFELWGRRRIGRDPPGGSVLIIIPGPDAVEGLGMSEGDRVRLVENDTRDAVADDFGVG